MYYLFNYMAKQQQMIGKISMTTEITEEIISYLRKTTHAESTKTLYGRQILDFILWFNMRNKGKKFYPQATDDDFYKFLEEQTDWSESYRYNAKCAIKSFYQQKFGVDHPMCSIQVRRHLPGPQRTLNWDKLEKLLGSLDTSTYKGTRDLAMIAVMVDTGLRAAEICNADMKFLDVENRTIQVRIKGGEWGTATYFDYAASCLDSWLSIRHLIARPETSTIFVATGGLHPGAKMTSDGLRSIFRELGEKSGLGLISPHDMRRTFATLASRAGAPTRVVQVAGRWSSVTMVERYTRALNPDDMAPYSPINKIMGVS